MITDNSFQALFNLNLKNRKAIPLPSFVEPMKAKLAKAASLGHWIYEIKFDG